MKTLYYNWTQRSFIILTLSIFLSLLLSLVGDYQITIATGQVIVENVPPIPDKNQGELLMYIVPWLKELIFIGLPMWLLITLRKAKTAK